MNEQEYEQLQQRVTNQIAKNKGAKPTTLELDRAELAVIGASIATCMVTGGIDKETGGFNVGAGIIRKIAAAMGKPPSWADSKIETIERVLDIKERSEPH